MIGADLVDRSSRLQKTEVIHMGVATSETARDINRRILLNLVRQRQPISRAALARATGLQRSTVSAITEQLIRERWVIEGAQHDVPRGRKPTLLHLNGERAGIVGIDLRPGTTTVALAGIDSRFLSLESLPTGSQPGPFLQRLGKRVRQMMEAHPNLPCQGVGVSVPGRFDPTSLRLKFAPSLGWKNVDLVTPLKGATGLPVLLENAANVCALAEFWQGRSAAGVRNLVAVTVSDGIDVGLIINGQLLHSRSGMAGEFGHVALGDDGPLCRCGNLGCWDAWASNFAACRFYSQVTDDHANEANGAEPTSISFTDLLRLAEQNDLKARQAIDRMAHYLGLGLAMLITGLAPEAIVVVGEVTRAWDRVGPIVAKAVKRGSFSHGTTRIVPIPAAEQSLLHGTIALVLQRDFGALTMA